MNTTTFNLPDAEVTYFAELFTEDESNQFMSVLRTSIEWQQDTLRIYGREINAPRLTAWYGDAGKTYSYSGVEKNPLPWTSKLAAIKQRVEAEATVKFNSVLLNLYRDGKDSVSWHSDDEAGLGKNPVIASVSFGATRRFHLRHKADKSLKQSIDLSSGSLLLMAGATQHHWQHQIPKTSRAIGERINLTFRVIH